jgi:hypothetical protein
MTRVQSGNSPQQQKANTLRGEYQRLMDGIRNDRTLSPHGKQKELATLYLDYKPRMEKLEADENTQHQTRAKALRRDLFGLPGYADPNTAISYRDAQDRAASIEDEQTALRLLNRAELSGDTSLAKAVAARAFEAGWNETINQYADANPASEAKFNELIEIESYGKGSAGFAQILGAAMTYSVEKPTELGMYNVDSQIQALANSDD